MTNEEAKFWFITETESEYITPAEHEAYTAAINAIEKQIPKKPNKFKNIYPNEQYICPVCDYCVGYKCGFTIPSREMYVNPFIKYKYCLKCGQAIDWSESDD